MNYRHIYHAGSFADIVKHLVLVAVLEQTIKKEKPFAVLDCFAGIGAYNLSLDEVVRSGESENGIKKILTEKKQDLPNLLAKLLSIVSTKNSFYLGSPYIIKAYLRQTDRLIACELHPQDFLKLKANFRKENNVLVHHMDAYTTPKSLLPFKESRGIIFLDPAFEIKNEFDKLLIALQIIKQRAANICTIIWYPIKNLKSVQSFYDSCMKIGFREILKLEFAVENIDKNMNKCGVIVINPPNIRNEICLNLDYLTKNIYEDKAQWQILVL